MAAYKPLDKYNNLMKKNSDVQPVTAIDPQQELGRVLYQRATTDPGDDEALLFRGAMSKAEVLARLEALVARAEREK